MKDEQTVDNLPLVGFDIDADADGIIMILVGRVPSNVSYLLERIAWKTSDAPALALTTFELFAGEASGGNLVPPPDTSLREFTTIFSEAAADEATPIRFFPGESITARWAGFTAGFSATIYLQVRSVEPVIAPVAPAEASTVEPPPSSLTAPVPAWG